MFVSVVRCNMDTHINQVYFIIFIVLCVCAEQVLTV